MYPYTKELTLDEAEKLRNLDTNVKAYLPDYKGQIQNPSNISCWLPKGINNNGKSLFITALDYATHILNQATPPEGWAYAAYELSSCNYEGLNFKHWNTSAWDSRLGSPEWEHALYGEFNSSFPSRLNKNEWIKWYEVAFRLTDLARVEGTEAATIPPSEIRPPANDWEAKYKELEERLADAQNCIAVQEGEITKLKNYIINQLLTN
jgi:hypothetical protein